MNQPDASIRILIVDDDADYAVLVRRALGQYRIEVVHVADGPSALRLLDGPDGGRIDLVLLDVQMPKQSGWEVLEQWRVRGRETPVIFLTGRNEVDERVKGLNLGADDYVSKSLQFKELVARIEAVVRRHRTRALILHGDLEIDLVRRLVRKGKRTLELSNREFDLLRVMASHPGRTFSRAQLLDLVWDIRFDPETNVVNVHIARLRKKMEVLGPPVIHTVRGEGYLFALEPPPDESGTAAPDPPDAPPDATPGEPPGGRAAGEATES